MRKPAIMFALIAGLGVATGVVAAAPGKPSTSDPTAGDVRVAPGRGRLGFGALEMSPELRKFFGAPGDRGVLVNELRADSPVARAGLRVGDVVTDVDGEPARSVQDIVAAIADRKKGDAVTIAAVRGKSGVTLQVKLEDDPGPQVSAFGRFNGGPWRAITPGTAPMDLREMFGDDDGRRELEETRKRLEELERRLEKLERK